MIKLYIAQGDYSHKPLFEIFEYQEDSSIGIAPLATPFFVQVHSPELADWFLIPVFITSLTSKDGQQHIQDFASLALRIKKPVGVFSNSDYITNPGTERVWIFSPGTYSSQKNMVELPAVIPFDPIKKWFDDKWSALEIKEGYSIGFCGQATLHPLKALKDFFKMLQVRRKIKEGNSPFLYVPFFLPVWERGRLLKKLSKNKSLKTDFILRQKYRGGYGSQEHALQTEKDFFENIERNLFTICLRGSGNYSVRFYQTLAMGRIPILIDTDSNLPFDDQISYENFLIVPYQDRFELEQYISDFLRGKTDSDLENLQKENREIWKMAFQHPGSLQYLANTMKNIASVNSI